MRSAIGGRLTVGALILTAGLAAAAGPVSAQETTVTTSPRPDQVQLTTPYAGVAVEPGNSATFILNVDGPTGDRVALEVTDVPEGWTVRLRGGGFEVSEVMVGTVPPEVELEVDVPEDATEGSYEMTVNARATSGNAELPITVNVAAAVAGSVELTAEFPALEGPADTAFSFDLDLNNDTPRELQFQLDAAGPDGWLVEATPAGETQAATFTVAAGESSGVTVDVTAPPGAEAGTYPVLVRANNPEQPVETELQVTITGSFELTLTTPDEVLNAEATAGESTPVTLLVVNSGFSPLIGVEMSQTSAPTGWDVQFEPAVIEQIAPGESAQVNALVTPTGDALAGDYLMTVNAATPGDEASDDLELRVTVNTSALWGLVGVGVIVLAFAGLAWVFRRYGRR